MNDPNATKGPLRHGWIFPLPADELASAARRCLQHHEGRLAFWDDELGEADSAFKGGGVTIRVPEEAQQYGTYRGDASVVIDQAKQARVIECQSKVKEHRAKRDEFDRWVRAFDRATGQSFPLTIDDMNYFRI